MADGVEEERVGDERQTDRETEDGWDGGGKVAHLALRPTWKPPIHNNYGELISQTITLGLPQYGSRPRY